MFLEMESRETDLPLPARKDEVKHQHLKARKWILVTQIHGPSLWPFWPPAYYNYFLLLFLNNTFCSLKVSDSYTICFGHNHPNLLPSKSP